MANWCHDTSITYAATQLWQMQRNTYKCFSLLNSCAISLFFYLSLRVSSSLPNTHSACKRNANNSNHSAHSTLSALYLSLPLSHSLSLRHTHVDAPLGSIHRSCKSTSQLQQLHVIQIFFAFLDGRIDFVCCLLSHGDTFAPFYLNLRYR